MTAPRLRLGGTTPIAHVSLAQPKFKPVFVMCEPRYLSTDIPNNTFMTGKNKEPVDVERACKQWRALKHLIEALGTQVLEIPPKEGAQDQAFTANIAVAIEPYIILANYKAAGRAIEVPPAKLFFESMGYKTIQPPTHFEGEADLKHLRDDIYIGGVGQFSSPEAFEWIERHTGVTIIPVRETNEKLYHLDCSLMVLDEQTIVASHDGLDRSSYKALEQVAEVIEVPKGLALAGVTNGIKIVDKKVLISGTLQPEDALYRRGIEWLLATYDKVGYVVTFADTDGVNCSGADASCEVLTLTFAPNRQMLGPRGRFPYTTPPGTA